MGSRLDATKVVSSLTLLSEVAKKTRSSGPSEDRAALIEAAEQLLGAAEAAGYPRCRWTLERLKEG